MKKILIASTVLLALAACGEKKATDANSSTTAVAAPTGTNWTETTSTSSYGGMVMGNPAAAVKLIEYGALTHA